MIGNILITSAGRRVSLVKNFQETVKRFNKNSKVFTTDMNPVLSSACQISDGYFQVPRVTEKIYLDTLKKICKENSISIVVPTIDTELHILAEAKEEFLKEGVLLAVSSKEFCETFYLKDSTEEFFEKISCDTPKIVKELDSAKYPLFAKLNNSSCSVGAQKVSTKELAYELLEKDKSYIFQEFIDANEFTVDTYIDKKSNVIAVVPRERLEVRAGEVSKAKAVKDEFIIEEIKKVAKELKGAFGCITIQLFKKDDRVVFIEINPRFGGGYPLSNIAGANFAEFLINDYLDISMSYFDAWKSDTIMLRYDAEVIVDGSSL